MALKRTALTRKTPLSRGDTALKRSKPKQRRKMPTGVAGEVARNSGKRCVRCGSRRALQRHHVLPVAIFPQYEVEPLCMVLACAGCHDEHERAHRRLRLDELPEAVVTWARTRGGREALYIERAYPR